MKHKKKFDEPVKQAGVFAKRDKLARSAEKPFEFEGKYKEREDLESRKMADKSEKERGKGKGRGEKKEGEGGKMKYLDWSSNGLTSLDTLHLFPDLLSLNLSNNKITQITHHIKNCSRVNSLNLSINSISKIENLASLKDLRVLKLARNEIKRIEGIDSIVQLENLDLSFNQISHIGSLWNNLRLKALNLSNNKISNCSLAITHLERLGDLLQNKNLEEIDLRNNQIETISNAHECLPDSVCSLYIGSNLLSDILSPLYLIFPEKLDDVDFGNNPFIHHLREYQIDYRSFIVFLTREKINYLNHSPVSQDEVQRSRKYFIEKTKFQVELFNQLVSENANRSLLIEYLSKNYSPPRQSPYKSKSPTGSRGNRSPEGFEGYANRSSELYENSAPYSQGSGSGSKIRLENQDNYEHNMEEQKYYYNPNPYGQTDHVSSNPIEQKPNYYSQQFSDDRFSTPPKKNVGFEDEVLEDLLSFKNREKVLKREDNETVAELRSEVEKLKDEISGIVSARTQQRSPQLTYESKKHSQRNNKNAFEIDDQEIKTPLVNLKAISVSTAPKHNLAALYPGIIKLQAVMRGGLVRLRMRKYKYQIFCIVKIQSLVRGVVTRKYWLSKQKSPSINLAHLLKHKKCSKCEENEKKIAKLNSITTIFKKEIKDLKKTKVEHEQALRYLFQQVSELHGQKTPKH